MPEENLLKSSIEKRLDEERYRIPREKKVRKSFNFRWVVIISIILGLLFSVFNLISYFSQF